MARSSIRIGNQTSSHVPAHLPFEFAMKNGFTAFEWFSDPGSAGWSEANTNLPTRHQWRRASIDHDIAFSVHAPFTSDPTTVAGATSIRRSFDFAADVGARSVNVHMLSEPRAEAFAEAVAVLLNNVRDSGVVLTLENTPTTSPELFNAMFRAFVKLPEVTNSIGMCLDTGHANLYAETKNDYIRFVDRLEDHVPIVEWHAHENWGDRDSHLTLFTGPAAHDSTGLQLLIRRLLKRGFCGSIILEQWPSPPELLVTAAERLRGLISACTDSIASE